MTHPPGTRLGSMRPGPTQPTRTGSHASAATHRQLEEAHLPRRSPHGKTEQGFPARETLTRGYSQRESSPDDLHEKQARCMSSSLIHVAYG